MIKIRDEVATREPVPPFLLGLAPESLVDLSWTDPELGVSDCAWWPEEEDTQGTPGPQEELSPDLNRRVVLVLPSAATVTARIEAARTTKVTEIEREYAKRLYSDTKTAIGVVQFRDERDRANLANMAQAATVLASADPAATVVWRTADNVTHTVGATDFIGVALTVMAEKQRLLSIRWAHKDAIRALTDLEAIARYDIAAGWD